MKTKSTLVLVGFIFLISIGPECHSQAIKKIFSPIPEVGIAAGTKKSEWRPIVNLPAIKLVESQRENAQYDAQLLTSTGGGISFQMLEYDGAKWKSNFSFSPLTILLTGNLSEGGSIDPSWAGTIGLFNNLIMVGGGYDFGEVEGRSRWFGLLSIGVSFNN